VEERREGQAWLIVLLVQVPHRLVQPALRTTRVACSNISLTRPPLLLWLMLTPSAPLLQLLRLRRLLLLLLPLPPPLLLLLLPPPLMLTLLLPRP
jgi:hypothetical protein